MDWLNWLWHTTFVKGGIAGLVPAVIIDYQAFKAFKSFDDFRVYNWKLAAWRWFQGFVVGGFVGLAGGMLG